MCKYCEGKEEKEHSRDVYYQGVCFGDGYANFHIMRKNHKYYIFSHIEYTQSESTWIKNCPMCGKKLG